MKEVTDQLSDVMQATVAEGSDTCVLLKQSTTYLQRNDPNKGSFQIFTGCQYTGAATLGKELFLYFGQRALRYEVLSSYVSVNHPSSYPLKK